MKMNAAKVGARPGGRAGGRAGRTEGAEGCLGEVHGLLVSHQNTAASETETETERETERERERERSSGGLTNDSGQRAAC